MNIFNKVALILFGLAGIGASREIDVVSQQAVVGGNGWSGPVGSPFANSVLWSRIVCVMMGTLAVLGMIPATHTLFGLWPLYGSEIALHGFFAILGAYFGFAYKVKPASRVDSSPTIDRFAA